MASVFGRGRKFNLVCSSAGHDEADGSFGFFLQMRDDTGGAREQGNTLQRREWKANIKHGRRNSAIDVNGQWPPDMRYDNTWY